MPDARVERLADVLVGYSADVRPGELVSIEGSLLATPLLVEIYRRIVRAGGHPLPRIRVTRQAELFYALANDEQLDWVNPSFSGVNEHVDRPDHRRGGGEYEEPDERRSGTAGSCGPGPPGPAAALPRACRRG